MSLSPQVLLSNAARDKCIAKLKDLPAFIHSGMKPKYKASVLLPLFVQNGEVHLLYTLRSSNLKAHSGQVSFPGGKMEGTEGVIETALRETEEEIGIRNNTVEIWSTMSPVQGRDKTMLITPVVGLINDLDIKSLHPNIHEVEEIFSVPMSVFCNRENHAHLMFNEMPLPLFLSGKHRIWGITGFITHMFLECFLPSDSYKVDFMRKSFTLDELMPSKL
ncbi:nucleoside diphosphate-linked moiety X motif 8-like [Pararge aegeria]|uniref:Jg3715 protein n=1 Tax=Pararge aegeria aegeria TaxID=348720 RepID=A0A8S4S7I5_9NEOP|nr:nucleoside diphosphate-linked moiety X motif 8-like [Pararge aegeria]CAH2246269.1 jg3715 [Pararge aegeria aegeria]